MSWNQVGEYEVTDIETTLPTSFISRLAIKTSNVALLKASWKWAGYFVQYLEIPDFGLTRIDQKNNLSTREPSLFIPTVFKPSYRLKFYKADWISSLTLTIYEDSMPINFEPAAPVVNVPNPFSSASASFTIPISATSVALLAANPNRKKLVIANNTNQDMYIDLDATASIADHCIKIPKIAASGFIANYELDDYTGVVSGIWAAAGTGAALIRELVL
jgi:hypothetical protein